MADIISPLDTATTDDLIAALAARYRATLGQACGQLDTIKQVYTVGFALSETLSRDVANAIGNTLVTYAKGHPANKTPPSFGFGPFGRR